MSIATRDEKEFQQRIQRIEGLIHEIEATADPAARARTEEVVQLLLELHGAGLERILDLVSDAGETGAALVGTLAGDELVGSLLLLHGLHPHTLEERVAAALEQSRPYLNSHGGDVELLTIVGDVVQLRLEGSCHGCPSSAMTLKQRIEEAIYTAAPEIERIVVEGLAKEPPTLPALGFVSLGDLLGEPDSVTP